MKGNVCATDINPGAFCLSTSTVSTATLVGGLIMMNMMNHY